MPKRWLEIFSAGTHADRWGMKRNYPIAELQQAVDNYDPSRYRPPLLVTHDTRGLKDSAVPDSEFCYGVPSKLALVGNKLMAGFGDADVAPEFLQWVANNNLIAISPSFYLPGDPQNPNSDQLSLRHIGAFGRQPVACNGLKSPKTLLRPAELSAPTATVVEFALPAPAGGFVESEGTPAEFSQGGMVVLSLLRRVREWLIESQGAERAEQVIPADALDRLPHEANSEDRDIEQLWQRVWQLDARTQPPSYQQRSNEPMTKTVTPEQPATPAPAPAPTPPPEFAQRQAELDSRAAELAAQQAELERRAAELAAQEDASARQRAVEFSQSLANLTAGDGERVVEILYRIETGKSGPVEFSAGTETIAEAFRGVLSRLCEAPPGVPDLEERTKGAGEQEFKAPEYQAADGYTVSPERARQYSEAKAYQRKHNCTLEEALAAVS
jgi:hypothetical protein